MKKISKYTISLVFIICIYLILLLLPLSKMLIGIDKSNILKVVLSSNFRMVLTNSINVAGITTLITLVFSYLLAWCIERTSIKHKELFSILLVLPMLIPSIAHGMGLLLLLGNNGILTRLFNIELIIYGKLGIILGSTMYAFPIAFLMFVNILRYEDSTPYEAAEVLGLSKLQQFAKITFPYIRKSIISIAFVVFTLVITDYGVPLMIGGKYSTIPVVMYQEVIGQLNFAVGSVYGLFLLIPALAAFLFDYFNRDQAKESFITKKFTYKQNTKRNFFAYAIVISTILFILLPIISFLLLAFTNNYLSDLRFTSKHILNTLNLNGAVYFLNSLIISLLVSIFGTVFAFVTAYITARTEAESTRYIHLIAITTNAIPGIVLGLSYVLFFKDSFIYGHIMILIMVNLIHFIASPYLMIYDYFNKLNKNLEAVGHTLGISRFKIIKDVILPQSKETVLEMAAYFFINSMITISAIAFLSTTKNKPVSLMINQFEAQMQLENAAIVSLVILFTNIIFRFFIYLLKNRRKLNVN